MMKVATTLAALLPFVAAWPTAMELDSLIKRQGASGRLNTGFGHPNPTFDAEAQYVDVSEDSGHEFQAPGPGDLRGQCPGLNAAANHGFLPRNGKTNIQQTVDGLGTAYNMSPELAAVLAGISILLSGDIPSTTWSIGGGFQSTLPLLLSNPKGLVGTHNKYEGDSSIIKGDAYLNDGKVGVFQMRSWNHLMSLIGDDLTLDKTIVQSQYVTQWSVQNNPRYFAGAFSGLVAPAAHNFVINFMSNHSAAVPGGTLTPEVLKSFFAVTGDEGNYVHHRGEERIPDNWFRRPGGKDQYNLPDVFLDLIAGAAQYPDTIQIGGNTGTVNSFTGVDVGDLTGGVFNGASLLQGNNLACFAFQAAMAGGIDELDGIMSALGSLLDPVLAPLQSAFAELSCPKLANFDSQLFKIFPGYKGT